MKKICFLFYLIFLAKMASAQVGSGKISGKAQAAHEGINGATVSVLRAKDSGQVKTVASNPSGSFQVDRIAYGQYILKVTAVGYVPAFTKPFRITSENNNIILAALELTKATKELTTVKVTSSQPFIENKIDKLVVNVQAAITNAGSTAMDVLERSPGITVDKDGNISLKGKEGVIILIDGKQTYLSASDLARLLKNMPANQLDQIEIMSQPSAKYDATGNSGIINIKTKKNQQQGFNGTVAVSFTQGRYPKTNNSFVFNKRKGKLNLFTTISSSYSKNFFNIDFVRNISDKSSSPITSVFDQESFNFYKNQFNSIKAGFDFFATKKTTFGAVIGITSLNTTGSGESNTTIYNGTDAITSYNAANSYSKSTLHNYSANLNFRHVIDTTGREFSADADYILYHKTDAGQTDNYIYDAYSNLLGYPFLLDMSKPSDIAIYTLKADYIHPITKVLKLEAGAKSSFVHTDNVADYTYYDHFTNSWKIDGRTNRFQYYENINAAYVNVSSKIHKWGYQLGLRLENTIAKGTQIATTQTFTKNYTQLFPTAYLSYAADKKNTFVLSFGKRIGRPSYMDMNPFRYFLDKFSYAEGNPNLTPQIIQNVELSHNYKGRLNTSLNYTRTTAVITDIFLQNDYDSTIVYKKENIATRRNIGISVNYNVAMNKVWNLGFSANVFNNYFEGVINNAPLSVDYTSFGLNTNNQLKFKKGWSAEFSGSYRYKNITASSLAASMGMIALGAAKQIMKNKGTLKLNIRDPFYTWQYRVATKFDNIDMHSTGSFDSRSIALAFTYSFGKNQKNVPQRKRADASQEEQNRVGQGAN